MAEVLLDATSQVTGSPTVFVSYPTGTRAMQLPDSNIDSYFLKAFGRPDRNLTCECERTAQPSMAQVLNIANGETINQKLATPGNRIEQLLAAKTPEEQSVDEVYLSALSRYPTPSERSTLAAAITEAPAAEKRQAVEDLYWGILSSKRFLFNH